MDLIKRTAWSYVYGLIGAAPFLPLVAYDPGGNDVGSALIGAALGVVVGLAARDFRAGIAPRTAISRMALSIAWGTATWFALIALAIAFRPRSHDVFWVLGAAILAVPAASAAGGYAHRPGRADTVIETLACLAAAGAFAVLTRHLLIFAPYVTFGPTTRPYPEWVQQSLFRSLGEHYAGSLEVGGFLIVSVPGVAFVAARLRAIDSRVGSVFADLALGTALLGWSYRLPAVLMLAVVVAASSSARFGWASTPGRILRIAVLLLALLPIDVTLQGGGHYWRVMPAVSGDFTNDGFVNGLKYGYVPLGGSGALFNEPHWFFVW